ncbi:MAG: ribbon-helix-helix protein, CopG family [Clostridia bacterium]|nr:ribbon-helix-helix protein, CopG family [Clostridia bacterium]
MPQLKKILITLPNSLLEEVDALALQENTNRSEFIREAMKYYIKYKKNLEIKERLKKGYQEMGEINLAIAEMCFEADNKQLDGYEEKLAECE